jgi:hypothetical protein
MPSGTTMGGVKINRAFVTRRGTGIDDSADDDSDDSGGIYIFGGGGVFAELSIYLIFILYI